MLSWSAQETGRRVDLAGIVDSSVEPGLPAGRDLVRLARQAARTEVDRGALDAVAAQIGLPAALDAAAVAANFEIMNRVVDATGLPIGRHRRDSQRELIAVLDLDSFPHAGH